MPLFGVMRQIEKDSINSCIICTNVSIFSGRGVRNSPKSVLDFSVSVRFPGFSDTFWDFQRFRGFPKVSPDFKDS